MRRSLLNRSTSYSDSNSSSNTSSSDSSSSSSASSYERSDEDERSSDEEEQDETRRRRMRLRRRIRSHRASAPTRTDSEEARERRTRIRLARRRYTSRENNTGRPQRRQSTRTQNILARVRRRRESRISPSEVNQIMERQQQSNNSNNSDNDDDDDNNNNNNRDDESSSDSYSSSDIFDDTDREDDGDVPPPRRIKPSLGLTLFRVATGDGVSSSDNNLAEVIKVQNIQALSQLTPQNSETYTAVVTTQESPRPNPSNNNNNNNNSTNDNNDIADDEQKTNLNNDNNNAIPIATVVEQISPNEVDNMIQVNANTSNTIINDLSYDDSIISGWMYKLAKIKLLGRESWHHRFMKFDISNGLLSISKDDEDNTTPYKEFNLSKIDIRIQPLNPDVETYGRKNIILVRQAQPINNTNINDLVTLLTLSCSSTSVFYRWLQAFSNVKSFVLPSS